MKRKTKTIIIKEKPKRRSNFWRNTYTGVKNWFTKYHIPVFTFSISVFASIGVVAYSAKGGEKLFPSFGLGFMLILILEFGFVTLRYIAVSIGTSRTTMFFINVFMVFLFILTIAPGTIGINQKVQEDRQGPGPVPVKSDLIASLESGNKALNDKVVKNTNIMMNTTSGKIFEKTQTENTKFSVQIEANQKIITEKTNEYDKALKEWNNKKTIAESKDPFVIFMRDFYLRFMIPGVQILNLFMSILGTGYLKKIKNPETVNSKQGFIKPLLLALYYRIYAVFSGRPLQEISLNGNAIIPDDILNRLAAHETKMDTIEKYTEKVVKDMEELAGELHIPVPGGTKPCNPYKSPAIEKKTQDAARPVFFKTTTSIGEKKTKKS